MTVDAFDAATEITVGFIIGWSLSQGDWEIAAWCIGIFAVAYMIMLAIDSLERR